MKLSMDKIQFENRMETVKELIDKLDTMSMRW